MTNVLRNFNPQSFACARVDAEAEAEAKAEAEAEAVL
jgi:hypothetical protein